MLADIPFHIAVERLGASAERHGDLVARRGGVFEKEKEVFYFIAVWRMVTLVAWRATRALKGG